MKIQNSVFFSIFVGHFYSLKLMRIRTATLIYIDRFYLCMRNCTKWHFYCSWWTFNPIQNGPL